VALTLLTGLRDRDSARQKITERYLLKCDEVFAICNIGRATTDAGVLGVFELARRARLSNVGIICTKADVSAIEHISYSKHESHILHSRYPRPPWSAAYSLFRISDLKKPARTGADVMGSMSSGSSMPLIEILGTVDRSSPSLKTSWSMNTSPKRRNRSITSFTSAYGIQSKAPDMQPGP